MEHDKLLLNDEKTEFLVDYYYYYLSRDSSETLIHAFVSSRLDYCNSLLYGLPQVQIDKIQRVQNAAARLTFEQPKFCHTTPVLSQLHWPPIKYRIEFKILLMTFKAIHGMAPDYNLFANWSAEGNQLDIPSDPAKNLCLRFQAARYSQHLVVEHSVMWPQCSGTTYLAKYPALTLSNFKCHVKTYLFKQAFNL